MLILPPILGHEERMQMTTKTRLDREAGGMIAGGGITHSDLR
ncbi:hypothetical protein [Luteimonas salinisoli]|nr:hypothetical protein [Luteimonas salinisoli]